MAMAVGRMFTACAVCWLAFQLAGPAALQAASKTMPTKAAAMGRDYASALAVADRFLQAWQSGDNEAGIVLLTARAKAKISRDDLSAFFSASAPSAYEISHGKPLRRGEYEFPVMLLDQSATATGSRHFRRRFSSIVVLRTGNNDWAIDKLP